MIDLIEKNRDAICQLCRRYNVARLEVFGSAAAGTFDPAASDVDFLVEFAPMEPGRLADAYFGLLERLRRLLGREIDLVTPKAVRNRFFQLEIDATRRSLYAA
jgi:predicted nucleotidyltransferase